MFMIIGPIYTRVSTIFFYQEWYHSLAVLSSFHEQIFTWYSIKIFLLDKYKVLIRSAPEAFFKHAKLNNHFLKYQSF